MLSLNFSYHLLLLQTSYSLNPNNYYVYNFQYNGSYDK